MDAQEIFDRAVSGVIEQGAPAMKTDGSCCLRHGDLKCAIGQLIPDEIYDPEMESWALECLALKCAVEDTSYNLELLTALQVAHDLSAYSTDDCEEFVEKFRWAARLLAAERGLSSAVTNA